MTGEVPRAPRRITLLIVIGALTALGPLSLDMYLPGMPGLVRDLDTDDSLGQLTLSACLLGLAAGQIFAGPLSDRVGRRVPVLAGLACFMAASIACAYAPTIEMLIALRVAQGLGGAAGLAVGRAVIRDLYDARGSAAVFSRQVLIVGIAPIVAPVIGGALLLFADWRGMFWILAGIGGLLFVSAWFLVPDSLAEEYRHTGGVSAQLRALAALTRQRSLMVYSVVSGLSLTILFAYVSMSSFVFQNEFGLNPQGYALVFALNSAGIVVGSQVNRVLLRRFHPHALLKAGIFAAISASGVAVAGTLFGAGFLFLLLTIWLSVSCFGLQQPNLTALALGPFARNAGSASAMFGTCGLLICAIIPPAVGALGNSSLVMTATMLISGVAGLLILGMAASRPDSMPPGPSGN